MHLQVPPLRERSEDIPLHTWPGNVRELQNAIESAVALSPRHELDLALLPEPESQWAADADASSDTWREALTGPDLKQRVEHFERALIVAALEKAKGNRSEAARALGVNRVTLLGKLIKYGLDDTDTTLDGAES